MFPPVLIVQIPVDRLTNAGVKIVFRLPAKLRLDLGRIDRISAVMTRTILDVADQAFRLVQRFQDGFDNLQVGPLIVSADVVNLTDASLVENQIDRLTMIGYVQPVANVRAVAYTGSSSSASARLIISEYSFSGKDMDRRLVEQRDTVTGSP